MRRISSRLKRLCDHPALVVRGARTRRLASGKFAAFEELLEETLAAGHKVVVFSQYLEMLDAVPELTAPRPKAVAQWRG